MLEQKDVHVGDMIAFYSSTAGKPKYHLCILELDENRRGFIFSSTFQPPEHCNPSVKCWDDKPGDYSFPSRRLPTDIPLSSTGWSVFSLSSFRPSDPGKFKIWKPRSCGSIDFSLAKQVLELCRMRETRFIDKYFDLICRQSDALVRRLESSAIVPDLLAAE